MNPVMLKICHHHQKTNNINEINTDEHGSKCKTTKNDLRSALNFAKEVKRIDFHLNRN